jgi:hypothetical protein
MTYSIFHSTRALQVFLEAFAVLALLIAWRWPRAGARLYRTAESSFSRLASVKWRAIIFAALLPLLLRLLLLPFFPVPVPRVHDEFSYLLLADTLAHGRVSNPTPLYWEHFETEYEIVRPAYASQYQPAQGLVLAAGTVLTNKPWWGVWLSIGLMCSALCWALGYALPPRWALFGSILAALQFGVFGFWMNSYFGGAIPAIGGALVFGALLRGRSVSSAALAGMGALIVIASRPVEGFIWVFAAAGFMLWRHTPKRSLIVFAALLVSGLSALGIYNARVTGNPLEPPYALYRRSYGTPQSYWWQPPVLVENFHHPELAANYRDQLQHWQRRYSLAGIWDSTWRRLRDFWRFFIGPFLTPALLFAFFALRRNRLRPWLWISALFILDHATYHAWYPQQSASETILILLFIVEGWRQLRIWRSRTRFGLAFSRNLTAAFATAFIILCLGLPLVPADPASWGSVAKVWDTIAIKPGIRDRAIRRLEIAPGKHLVFVRYGANHPWYDEWVFNAADIPGSRIVFARMCSPESDLALARSMHDRDVWIASPDDGPLIAKVTQEELLVASADQ